MTHFRDHQTILSDAGGVPTVRKLLAEKGHDLPDATVRSWITRNSIPVRLWPVVVGLDLATLDELAGVSAGSPAADAYNGHMGEPAFPSRVSMVGVAPGGFVMARPSHGGAVENTGIDGGFSGDGCALNEGPHHPAHPGGCSTVPRPVSGAVDEEAPRPALRAPLPASQGGRECADSSVSEVAE